MSTIYTPSSIPLRIPFAPNRGFNFTKPIHIRNRTTKLTNYQIEIDLNTSNFAFEKAQPNGADIRFQDTNGKSLTYWIESWTSTSATIWVKLNELESYEDRIIWLLYGNFDATIESNGDNTFEFFDDFTGTTINEKYFTNWNKSGSNPLQTKTCQNWFIAVYSDYNSEDKIYLFEQRNAHPSTTISAWSFTRANAANTGQWTDHGTVFTGVGAHDNGHVEPHGIIFETQSMADAREAVGEGLGTKKWRMYYCAKGNGEGVDKYSANFAYAAESDLTSWTAYSNNPVYDHDATYGYADSKVCIYDSKVWMHHCKYTGAVSCNPAFFSYSDDGISSWTDTTRNWTTEETVLGTLVPFSTGILLSGTNVADTACDAYFTTDGDNKATYSSNPFLSGGGGSAWDNNIYWYSIAIDKNGSADLNSAGTYYLYYIGHLSGTYKLGLATSTTLTEESEIFLDSNKWDGDASISSGEATITGAGSYIRTKNTYTGGYASRLKAKGIGSGARLFLGGFALSGDSTSNSDFTTALYFFTDWSDFYYNSGNGTNSEYLTMGVLRDAAYHTFDTKRTGTVDNFNIDGGANVSGSYPTNLARYLRLYSYYAAGSLVADWAFIRKYVFPEPLVEVL